MSCFGLPFFFSVLNQLSLPASLHQSPFPSTPTRLSLKSLFSVPPSSFFIYFLNNFYIITMMLVQKPHSILLPVAPYTAHHRRQTSAPVVVQPTNVPGMLSLSKPVAKQSPQRHLNSNQRQSNKQTPKPFVRPQVVRAPTIAELPQSEPLPPATPSPRGRAQGKSHKEKALTTKRWA